MLFKVIKKETIVDTRKAMDGQAVAAMLVLGLVFSLQQVGIKAAAHDMSPILQIALRSGIAAVLVGMLMLVRNEKIAPENASWQSGLAVGGLFALEFLFLGEGLRYTSASHAVVFLYTGPIFAALGLHVKLPTERLDPLQWFGIALAFMGIAIAFFVGGVTSNVNIGHALFGDFLCILAGLSWGATTVVIRCSSLSSASATRTLLYQLIGAFVILLGAAFMLGQTAFNATPLAMGNLVFQSLIVSFAGYLAWFGLLRRYLASRLGAFSFMTPLFGVVLGAWLLEERIRGSFLVGAGFVLLGIALVSGHVWLRQTLLRQTWAGQALHRISMPDFLSKFLLGNEIRNKRYHHGLNNKK